MSTKEQEVGGNLVESIIVINHSVIGD